MSILTRPILEINLDNLLDNYLTLKKISGKAIAAAVVKDDAYGLGAKKVAKLLYDKAKCRHFFVAHGVEGKEVREVAPDAFIYVLQGIGEDSLEEFNEAKLIPVISSKEQLAFWKENRISGIKPIVNIETGLNRLGFREYELSELEDNDRKEFSFVMSHLACGDAKEHFMNQHQLNMFNFLRDTYFPKLPASLSASDGTFLGISGISSSIDNKGDKLSVSPLGYVFGQSGSMAGRALDIAPFYTPFGTISSYLGLNGRAQTASGAELGRVIGEGYVLNPQNPFSLQ